MFVKKILDLLPLRYMRNRRLYFDRCFVKREDVMRNLYSFLTKIYLKTIDLDW